MRSTDIIPNGGTLLCTAEKYCFIIVSMPLLLIIILGTPRVVGQGRRGSEAGSFGHRQLFSKPTVFRLMRRIQRFRPTTPPRRGGQALGPRRSRGQGRSPKSYNGRCPPSHFSSIHHSSSATVHDTYSVPSRISIRLSSAAITDVERRDAATLSMSVA